MKNILTFDIEEYFQVENFKENVSYREWGQFESRLQIGIDRILKILSDFKMKATFFVLGWSAEQHPKLIQKISGEGHEIASHGYSHELIYKQSKDEFHEDLKKSLQILKDVTGKNIESFRAASFSITKKSLWALDLLIENGIKYDSSIFPIFHDRYGIPDANPLPHVILEKNGRKLNEFPITTFPAFGKQIPFSGGGYLRLLPRLLIKKMIHKLNKKGTPVMLYLHPWEFDPDQPKIRTKAFYAFRHYLNIHKTEAKLRSILQEIEVTTLKDFFEGSHEKT